jgi:hypothetical protein
MNDSTQTMYRLVGAHGLELFETLRKERRNSHLLIVVLLGHSLEL